MKRKLTAIVLCLSLAAMGSTVYAEETETDEYLASLAGTYE